MYTAKERLYRTSDGRAVKEGDADSAFLLVPEGGTLSDADAKKYGLIKSEPETQAEPEPESKAITEAPENKAIRGKSTK